MKALILGVRGQLGQALIETAPGEMGIGEYDVPYVDITDNDALITLAREVSPAVIVNAAAYTAVDQAESEPEPAHAVNVLGARNAALAAREVDARLVHVSTDFVFDGRAAEPYAPEAETCPLSVYGSTKRDGELAVVETLPEAAIVRTAWLYSRTGANFVRTMLGLMKELDELRVVADQIGSPTWANSLANAIWAIADQPGVSGIYHWTDAGQASWYEFAVAIQEEALSLDLLDAQIPIRAIKSDEYPTAATRPKYSVLDCSSLCERSGLQREPWRINLRRMLKGMTV